MSFTVKWQKKVSYAAPLLQLLSKSPVCFAIQEMNNEVENEMAIQPEYEAKLS